LTANFASIIPLLNYRSHLLIVDPYGVVDRDRGIVWL